MFVAWHRKTGHKWTGNENVTPHVECFLLCSLAGVPSIAYDQQHEISLLLFFLFFVFCFFLFKQYLLLYSWHLSRYSASIHWPVRGHMISNNETVSRQMP